MYIKVEQINGKYRVTPDVQVGEVQPPRGLEKVSPHGDFGLVFANIPERPYGIYCNPYPENPSTDVWKEIENDNYTIYDNVGKSLVINGPEGYYFPIFSLYDKIDPPETIYFLKFDNRIYGVDTLSQDEFYDLIPYTEVEGPQVRMDGNVLTPNTVIRVPYGTTIKVDIDFTLNYCWCVFNYVPEYFTESITNKTINSNYLIVAAVDEINHKIGLNKYVFERY